MSAQDDLNFHIRIAQRILRALSCSRAQVVSYYLEHGMWDEIASLTINPSNYTDPEYFFREYQATRLLSKAKWLRTSWNTTDVAKGKFADAEEQCRRTNSIWGPYRRGEQKFDRDIERLLFIARRKIGMVLGSDLYAWTELCDFGPGADGSTARGMTSAYNKLSNPGSITGGAYPFLETFAGLTTLCHIFKGNIATRRLEVEIVRGNKVTFVPKNAKTDRPIAVEPRWNIWMQKGVGAYLRRRLKRFRVDLDDQRPNQSLAIQGSRTNQYATIDLASASDTVSKEVVEALLPHPWLTVLSALRSPQYSLNGEWREYEKWSSMGNGYTFELESLLFWALCSAVTEDISVYGDDLVVPVQDFDAIVKLLDHCGFSTNVEKSYGGGPFRESCGKDAFLGVPVTPIYWKEPLHDQGRLTLVNQISVLASRLAGDGTRCRSLRPVWKDLVYQLPRRFQRRGPTTVSSVVHDCQTSWNAVRQCGWDGVHINIEVPVPRKRRYLDYDAAVLSQFFQPSSFGYQIRDHVAWKKRTVFIPCGYEDIGPWG